MARSRRRRTTKRHPFRSPIEPGIVSVNPKVVMGVVPVLMILASLTGGWYLMRERQALTQAEVTSLRNDVEAMKLEHAAEQDDHTLLLKIQEDVQKVRVRLHIE